jgi:Ca2+-binding EF-hand superfamily protein
MPFATAPFRKTATTRIIVMPSRRNVFPVALAALLGVAAPALAANKTGAVMLFDADNDGTVDLNEAKKAASALFDKLDTDKDGTLDFKELKGRLTRQEFTAADPDKDGTLTKDEYLAVVEKHFKAADPDNDDTVSTAEFETAAGRALSKLLS